MHAPNAQPLQIPVVETERLRLRGHRIDDFANSAALWADPEVTRYIRRLPFSTEECWTRLLRYAGHWALLGFGYWLVEEKLTGVFLGEVGFADYKREIEPSLGGMPEIGWVIAPHSQGKGYAAEAVAAVVAWGDAHFGSAHTACIIDPANAASIRVAYKAGYRELAVASYKGETVKMYTRPAPLR